jgi:hypothetical protein
VLLGHRSLTLHGADVWSISNILSESADRARDLRIVSAHQVDKAEDGRTHVFVLSPQRNDGDEAEGKPVPALDRVSRPVPAVVTLRCHSFIALEGTRKV